MEATELAEKVLLAKLRAIQNLDASILANTERLGLPSGESPAEAAFAQKVRLSQVQMIASATDSLVRQAEAISRIYERVHNLQQSNPTYIFAQIEQLYEPYLLDEDACQAVLTEIMWPSGAVCPQCNQAQAYRLHERNAFQCRECRHQFSITTNTVLHGTHLEMRVWLRYFLAFHSLAGQSVAELQRTLKVSRYETLRTARVKYTKCLEHRNPVAASAGLLGLITSVAPNREPGLLLEARTDEGGVKAISEVGEERYG